MNGAGPPRNGKAALQGRYPENSNADKLERDVTDKAAFCNNRLVEVRRASAREQWHQLRNLAELPGVERFSQSVADWRAS